MQCTLGWTLFQKIVEFDPHRLTKLGWAPQDSKSTIGTHLQCVQIRLEGFKVYEVTLCTGDMEKQALKSLS